MKDCIFCKIIKNEIPCYKIRENDTFLALLDIFPNCSGQTLLISKKHYESDLFALNNTDLLKKTILATNEVIQLLKKKLHVQRVSMVMEGMGINHLHIKLYPMHGLEKEREENIGGNTVFFETYPGYITTEIGQKISSQDAEELQKKITAKE